MAALLLACEEIGAVPMVGIRNGVDDIVLDWSGAPCVPASWLPAFRGLVEAARLGAFYIGFESLSVVGRIADETWCWLNQPMAEVEDSVAELLRSGGTRVVCASRTLAEGVGRRGLPVGGTVPFPVDLDAFAPPPSAAVTGDRRLRPGDPLKVLATGNGAASDAVNGFTATMSLCCEMAESGYEVELTVDAEPPLRVPLRDALEKVASTHGVGLRAVHWSTERSATAGFQGEALRAADLVVICPELPGLDHRVIQGVAAGARLAITPHAEAIGLAPKAVRLEAANRFDLVERRHLLEVDTQRSAEVLVDALRAGLPTADPGGVRHCGLTQVAASLADVLRQTASAP